MVLIIFGLGRWYGRGSGVADKKGSLFKGWTDQRNRYGVVVEIATPLIYSGKLLEDLVQPRSKTLVL